MHKKLYFSLAVFGLSLPVTLFAATSTTPTVPPPANQLKNTLTEGPESVRKLLVTLADWAFTIFLAVAVIMIVVAAFKYLTSGGGDGVKDAHKMLIYAVIAIIIAFLAKGFVTVVEGLVGVSSTGSSVPTSPPTTGGPTAGTPPPGTPPPPTNPQCPGGFCPLTFIDNNGENPFAMSIQMCRDGLKPALRINWSEGTFTTFPEPLVTGKAPIGNPEIPGPGAQGSAGRFVTIGYFSTGFANLGTRYDITAEVCNDDMVPVVMVDEEKDGSFVRVTD